MILTEEEVYNGAKHWLIKNHYSVIAGQPARGVDHLPVIEIKQPTGEKGSKRAYKPDLVAYRQGVFYIVECKPEYSIDDELKINDVLHSSERKKNFYRELRQYKLLERLDYRASIDAFCNSIEGILAFSGAIGAPSSLHKLIVANWKGDAQLI